MPALFDSLAAHPGAVVNDGVLAHFGDPMREQRTLARGGAFVLLGDRTVIEGHTLRRSRIWHEWMLPQDMTSTIGCKLLQQLKYVHSTCWVKLCGWFIKE